MLMVNLMIILFHLKSDKFYCIRAMNYLKEIFQQFLFIKKWVITGLIYKNYYIKQKTDIKIVVVKKKFLNTILEIKILQKKKKIISKSLSKEESGSKKNMEETGTKIIKRQAKNINFMQSIKWAKDIKIC